MKCDALLGMLISGILGGLVLFGAHLNHKTLPGRISFPRVPYTDQTPPIATRKSYGGPWLDNSKHNASRSNATSDVRQQIPSWLLSSASILRKPQGARRSLHAQGVPNEKQNKVEKVNKYLGMKNELKIQQYNRSRRSMKSVPNVSQERMAEERAKRTKQTNRHIAKIHRGHHSHQHPQHHHHHTSKNESRGAHKDRLLKKKGEQR